MKLIILRHAESVKNTHKQFSSDKNNEKLTDVGFVQVENIANAIFDYVQRTESKVQNVYCAESTRAISTAIIIADKLKAKIMTYRELLSVTTDAQIKGKSEEEIKKFNPQFINELELYRAGIFNAYNYTTVADQIKSGKYEQQIAHALTNIVGQKHEDIKIIVMHHSSLTAAIIRFARIGHSYPIDFYGNIMSDLGKIYVVELNGDICNILHANASPEILKLL